MIKVTEYSRSMRLLHWIMAVIVLSLLFAGLTMVRSLEPWQFVLLQLHKSFGTIAFILVLIRLMTRFMQPSPELPTSLPKWQRVSARASHVLLYACMLLMPLSGYLMQNAAGRPVEVFAAVTLPALLSVNLVVYGVLREIHAWISLAFIALLIMHIGAALQHGLIRRDGVLRRMAGRRRS